VSQFSDLLGKTLSKVEIKDGDHEILFTCDDNTQYRMWHRQDCCESVWIEDFNGTIGDLVGSPILQALKSKSKDKPAVTDEEKLFAVERKLDQAEDDDDDGSSHTWTFYRIATIKGSTVIRWHGTSNGYYSESVDFVRLGSDEDW